MFRTVKYISSSHTLNELLIKNKKNCSECCQVIQRLYYTNDDNDERNSRKKSTFALLLSSLGLGIGIGIWFRTTKYNAIQNIGFGPIVSAANPIKPYDAGSGSGGGGGGAGKSLRAQFNFIADVVSVVAPQVVYIEIKDTRRIDFFTGAPATTSNGSGFIVREDGLILTNAHVVISKPHSRLQVRLMDGRTFTGVIEDIDMKSDLATVRIPVHNLPAMKLGSSLELRPGEFVVAIGSPLSLSNTCTCGVISSSHRTSTELGLQDRNMDYIQTDASITFGNSGGPLVNLDGEAIGINAMKVTAGISFAIPIDYAKDFLRKSEEKRKSAKLSGSLMTPTKRRYMGVTMLTLTPQLILELQAKNRQQISDNITHGVLIWKVVVGSPAHMGGLRPGDIVTHINKQPVHSAENIYYALEKQEDVHLTVVRGTIMLQVAVTPEEI